MSEQRLLDELDALDAEAERRWWTLPEDGPEWPLFEGTPYGVTDASGPVNAETVHPRIKALRIRKRRMVIHALLCSTVLLAFCAAFIFDVQPLLPGEAIWALGGGASAALLLMPSFVEGHAREEKRLTLYRLLATHYGDA